MRVISIPTSFNIDVEFELPGFGRRAFSLFIDICLQIIYLIIAFKLLNYIERTNNWNYDDSRFNMWAITLLLMLPISIYHILMETTTNGQSPGKKIMSLRVVNANGGPASISQFIIRWLLRVSDLWMAILLFLLLRVMAGEGNYESLIIFFLGFCFLITDIVLVAVTKKSQRIGDILANTILIKTNTSENLSNTVFMEVGETYQPLFPEVMRISDKDLNVIKTILDNCQKSGNFAPAKNAAEKIKAFLNVQSSLEPEDFLDRLLKDYNYLSAR